MKIQIMLIVMGLVSSHGIARSKSEYLLQRTDTYKGDAGEYTYRCSVSTESILTDTTITIDDPDSPRGNDDLEWTTVVSQQEQSNLDYRYKFELSGGRYFNPETHQWLKLTTLSPKEKSRITEDGHRLGRDFLQRAIQRLYQKAEKLDYPSPPGKYFRYANYWVVPPNGNPKLISYVFFREDSSVGVRNEPILVNRQLRMIIDSLCPALKHAR
jgi:hypothetical protein